MPLKLGLAGGPLVVALILARIGSIGKLYWFMPPSANLALREIGIVLFLAVVGLKSGGNFVDTLVNGSGLEWMVYGIFITFVPLMIVGIVARLYAKMNYLSLCGLLAGSMTDPPALAFANAIKEESGASALSYATVYPLVMFLLTDYFASTVSYIAVDVTVINKKPHIKVRFFFRFFFIVSKVGKSWLLLGS